MRVFRVVTSEPPRKLAAENFIKVLVLVTILCVVLVSSLLFVKKIDRPDWVRVSRVWLGKRVARGDKWNCDVTKYLEKIWVPQHLDYLGNQAWLRKGKNSNATRYLRSSISCLFSAWLSLNGTSKFLGNVFFLASIFGIQFLVFSS